MVVAPELEGIEVFSVVDGAPRQAQNLVGPELLSKVHISAFLTHFADFNAWEYAQRLKAVDAELAAMGVELTLVGIGTQAAGAKFAELLDLPADRIYADPTGASHRALGFSPGALPNVEIPPLVKLAVMLGGVGSPGTIEAVIRGYFGDPSADAKWVNLALQQGAAKGRFPAELPSNAFDNVGRAGLRPFELATLRLQNMLQGILQNWEALAPKDPSLALQQGGTVVYDWRGELIYRYADEGILVYTPVDEMLTAIKESIATAPDGGKAMASTYRAGAKMGDGKFDELARS
jgi:hypothetical protein